MKKLNKTDLHDYQNQTVQHIVGHSDSMLWLGLGLGKTISSLTAFDILQKIGAINAVLVIAPLRVCQLVWRQEGLKWQHVSHLTFSVMCGSEKKRIRALFRKADVYLINYESLSWLSIQLQHYFIDQGKPLPFDMLIFDEVSKVKRSASKRFEAFSPIAQYFNRRVGLTASPCSNGLHDLWAQFFMLDGGARLGTHYPTFQSAFFHQVGQAQHNKWEPYKDTRDMIVNRISDMTIEMSAADHLDMPELLVVDVEIDLPPAKAKLYAELEKNFFIELDEGGSIEVFNRAALCNKLLQFSNGIVYNYPDPDNMENQVEEFIHDEKYKALDDIIANSGDEPILLAYNFSSERREIEKRYPKARCLTGVSEEEAIEIMTKFNNGQIKLLIGHPLCLVGDTEVLTETRGWVKITNIKASERVFDGVDFVAHDGCSYSGYSTVIDVFGIGMTPEHRLKINEQWVKGKDVRDNSNTRREACYTYKGNDTYISAMCPMQRCEQNDTSIRKKAQQVASDTLSTVSARQVSHDESHKILLDMAAHARTSKRSFGRKLSRSWGWCLFGMGSVRELLQRYVFDIFGSPNNRANRREWKLRKVKLQVDHNVRSTSKQENNKTSKLQRCANALGRIVPAVGVFQNNATREIEQRNERRSSRGGCSKIELQQAWSKTRNIDWSTDDERTGNTAKCIRSNSVETSENKQDREVNRKEHVYDLVNCGVRKQFLVRNPSGDIFISHNSAGHGINLQESCHIVVWFGLNYNLELYEQFIGRIDRQGQSNPVQCFRIVCRDTMDYAVMGALYNKDKTQSAMRDAIGSYRGKAIDSEVLYEDMSVGPPPPKIAPPPPN